MTVIAVRRERMRGSSKWAFAPILAGMRAALELLLAPTHLYAWAELADHDTLPPRCPGTYGWYFDMHALPAIVPTLDLPLNLAGNRRQPFHATLSEFRRAARARARR